MEVIKKNIFIQRLLWTILFLLLYRFGTYITIFSGFSWAPETIDLLSGGAVNRTSLFSLHIIPYISMNIFLSLFLFRFFPSIQKKLEGNLDKRQLLIQIGTLFFAFIQAFFLSFYILKEYSLYLVVFFIFGTTLLQWIAQQITIYGLGNGISILLFVGIVFELGNKFLSLDSFYAQMIVFLFITIIVFFILKIENIKFPFIVNSSNLFFDQKRYTPFFFHLPLHFLGIVPMILYQILVFSSESIIKEESILLNTTLLLISSLISYLSLISQSFKPNWIFHLKNQGFFFPGLNIERETYLYIQHRMKKILLLNIPYLWIICIFFPKALTFTLEFYGLADINLNTVSIFISIRLFLSIINKIQYDYLLCQTDKVIQ